MKSLFFVFILGVSLYPTYESGSCKDTEPIAATTASQPEPVVFSEHIQPILIKRCSPCHFTGGKMYPTMPFDNAATILNPEFKNGLLKRIKEEKENVLLKEFIKENNESKPNQ